MAKKITYADDARRTILRGVNKLADAVKAPGFGDRRKAMLEDAMLTTEALVSEIKEKEGGNGGGGIGGMY